MLLRTRMLIFAVRPDSQDDYSWGMFVDEEGNAYITGAFGGVAYFGNQALTSAGGDGEGLTIAGGSDGFFSLITPRAGQFVWATQIQGTPNAYRYGRGAT